MAITIIGGGSAGGESYDQSLNTTDFVSFAAVGIGEGGNISLPNNTQITVGSFDNMTGGEGGISLHCAVGYELNWQGGRLRSIFTGDVSATPQPISCDSSFQWQGENGTVAVAADGITFPDGTTQSQASAATYRLSATTNGTTPAILTGDSLALESGEAWQFEIKLVARNRKTDGTKVWSIRGGIRKSFAGAVALVGSLDTQATGQIGGGNVSVTAQPSGLTITVTGVANTSVDWQATILTSEKTSTQQPQVGGCTDPDVGNYNANADFDNGSCSYSSVPSSAALEPIASEGEITSLEVTVGANSLYPTFDPAIKDYYVKTSAAYLGNASYSVTINGGSPVTGTVKAGRTLQINDGTNYYYVRLLPSDVAVGTVEFGPTEGYVPGYYLAADSIFDSAGYGYVYDERGVPVWYGKSPGRHPISLHAGRYANRVLVNTGTGETRTLAQINSASVSRVNYELLESPTYGAASWGSHETRELALPVERAGNIVSQAYDDGFYIQEQSASGDLVWEWHSKDYFTSQDPEFYHINSVDVHPTTGNLVVSLRNCSAVLCIEYATKDVLWVLQGSPSPSYGTLQSQAIAGKCDNTKWLTISGEPTVDGFQYNGTRAQHDARWRTFIAPLTAGNEVISVYDNQSDQHYGFTSEGAGPLARGVIYEINAAAGTAIHRSSVFSELGTAQFMGSYTVVDDGDTLSHAIDSPTQHPALVEFVGAVADEKAKSFAMDVPGNVYRIIKVPTSFFRADNLRATCGVNVDTGALPSGGGGGGGGGGGIPCSLLLHFDGSNGSTSFTDSSGNGLTATANGDAAISTAESKFGGASLSLDANGDYLTIPYSESLNLETGDWTAECWWYPTDGSLNGQNLLSINANGQTTYAQVRVTAYTDSGNYFRLLTQSGGDWTDTTGGGSWAANQWHHLAAVRSGNDFKLYVDGVQAIAFSSSNALTNGNGVTVVGAVHDGGVNETSGYIDELRVIKGTAVYTANFTPPTAPFPDPAVAPALLLHFDGNFTDSSPNGFTVTPQSGAVLSTAVSKFGGSSVTFPDAGSSPTAQRLVVDEQNAFNFGTGDFTIEAWCYFNGFSNEETIFAKTNNTIGYRLAIDSATRRIRYVSEPGNAVMSEENVITTGQWYHIACVRQSGQVKIYLDGVQVASGADPIDVSSSVETCIGGYAVFGNFNEYESTFNGYIDELRVMQSAVYTDDFTPPTAPFTA